MRGQMKPTLTPAACPFCGSPPELEPDNPETDGNAWGEVRCTDIECATHDHVRVYGVSVSDGESVNDDRGPGAYIDAAITRWNRRGEKLRQR